MPVLRNETEKFATFTIFCLELKSFNMVSKSELSI